LFAGEESSVVENSEHIVFVVLHLGKNAAGSVAVNRLDFQQRAGEKSL
jgi:hypothetical protein